MNPTQVNQNSFEESSERSQPSFFQHPENRGDKDQDHVIHPPTLNFEEEKVPSVGHHSVHLTSLKGSAGQLHPSKDFIDPLVEDLPKIQSSQELFNRTVNIDNNQKLLEIEEKRKKRRIRKAQKHFRGSSFGQGSAPKNLPEVMKSYEYGSNGYVVEDSSDNAGGEYFSPPTIDTLKNKITKAVSGKHIKERSLSDRKVGPQIVSDLIKCVSNVSNEDLLEYIIDIEKEKHELELKFSEDYKKLKQQMTNVSSEYDKIKGSYKELLSKFSGKEIQIRGYRLALNNANELLYEVIDKIERSITQGSIPLKEFINSMNMKIMKLLENSTKELHTLTDINPQSSLNELESDPKDPIEDAFNHLRSLLTFQTALKKASKYCATVSSPPNQLHSPDSSQDFSSLYTHSPKPSTVHNSIHSENASHLPSQPKPRRQPRSKKRKPSQPSYSQLATSRSQSRDHKKPKTSTKIYSQLVTGRGHTGHKG